MSFKAVVVSGLLALTSSLASATSVLVRDGGQGGSDDGGGYGGYGGFGGFGGRQSNPGDYFNDHGRQGAEPETLSTNDITKFNSLNYEKAAAARIAHAVLASLAFVIFFPMGAICIRILPGKIALILHGLFQLFAYLVFTAAVGLGIWLCVYVRFSDYHLVSREPKDCIQHH